MRALRKETTVPTIRVATPEDTGQVAAIYRPIVEATAISFEDKPPTTSTWISTKRVIQRTPAAAVVLVSF